MSSPRIFVIAGPNGAGKTTFAEEFLPGKCREFVNADLIAKGLSPFQPDAVGFEAGRIMLGRIDDLIARGVDFAFETTLSGRAHRRLLQRARGRGYVVDLTFLWLPSVDLAIARVARRVQLGGHGVPDEVIRRRYGAGIRNLIAVYTDVVDSWTLFDNSVHPSRPIAFQEHSVVSIIDEDRYRVVYAMAERARDDV